MRTNQVAPTGSSISPYRLNLLQFLLIYCLFYLAPNYRIEELIGMLYVVYDIKCMKFENH